MDPVMYKLLELWELDDTALGNHSLQASSSLSINKHLSLYNEKSVDLEPLHHEDSSKHSHKSHDSATSIIKTSHGPAIAWTESSSVESPDVQFCEKCRYANEEHANWCIECGTALMGTKIEVQSGDDSADLNGEVSRESLPPLFDWRADQNPASDIAFDSLSLSDDRHACSHNKQKLDDKDIGPKVPPILTNLSEHTYTPCNDSPDSKQIGSLPKFPKRSLTSPIMSQTHPNNKTKKFHTTTNKNVTTSQLITRKDYQRHWNTSSTYMWRKPSSIPKSTCSLENEAHHNNWTQLNHQLHTKCESHTPNSILPKLTNNQVPALDLDAIDEGSLVSTSVCTSIRTSSSIINEVWILWAARGRQIKMYILLIVTVEPLYLGHTNLMTPIIA